MTTIIFTLIAFIVGAVGTYVLFRVFNKKARQEAEAEAELLKKNKLIEAKARSRSIKYLMISCFYEYEKLYTWKKKPSFFRVIC